MCFFHGLLGNFYRRNLVAQSKYRHIQLFAQNLQLGNSSRTVNVACNQQRFFVLALQVVGQLAGGSSFTCALQTNQHDNCRRFGSNSELALGTAQKLNQLFIYNLDNLLMRIQAFANRFTNSALFNLGYKVLNNLEVNVGLQKRHTHFAHRSL